ncbi:MAG: ABC transporter ATP-binding protein [Bacteroidota bacterium]
MKELAYLNSYFGRYKKLFALGFLFVVLSNYFRVLQPQMIRQAFDLVVENINYYRQLEGFGVQQELFSFIGKILLFFGLLVVGLAIIMGIFMYFMRQTIIVMSRYIEYDLRKVIYDHYQRLDQGFYRKNNTGDLMARITEDVNKVRMYLGPAVLYGINLLSLFVLVIYSMLRVNVELTLYALAPLPILSIAIYYVSNIINKKSTLIQRKLSELNSDAQEVYSGIRVVKSYVQERFMSKYFADQSEAYRQDSLSLAKVDALFYPTMLILIGTSIVVTVLIGGVKVIQGIITPGNIAEFVIYVNMLTWPVTAIGWIASIIQQAAASQTRINEFLNVQPKVTNTVEDDAPLKGDISFNDVTFEYPDTGIVAIRDMSLELEAGQKLAIIGRTGSGKTTVADLLTRMYDVTEGSIKIDGRDLREHSLDNLRQRIGYVPQDVFLFSDTLANNIAFGKRDATLKEVKQYAKYASIHNEIMDLPENYETMVGERGVTLSGGQKQRTSIARALIKQPDILLLDDCLSAVDTKTEKQILSYFEEALANKTVIIITHRIYSLLEFDKIIVLDEGRIVEEGNHQQLLANEGYYYDLYQKQIREEVVEVEE